MSMHGSYDEYGQNDTADLVRSVALSSAKLWEEVFERLRHLEEAQAELRAMLGRIEGQLPSGSAKPAITSGAPGSPTWSDRAIGAPEPRDGTGDVAQTDLFVPGPMDHPGHEPMDAVDLLVGNGTGTVSPPSVDQEPAAFFFRPADEARQEPDSAGALWPAADPPSAPAWTEPRTVRYDEGFTSRDVVGPPTEEVQAIDVSLPERSNAEYFGRHAAGPMPAFSADHGDPDPASAFEPLQVHVPQVQVPGVHDPSDPAIYEQLQQAAQAVEASTGSMPGALSPPPFRFATGAELAQEREPGFEDWGGIGDTAAVPLAYAPGDEPVPEALSPVPPPPPGFGMTGDIESPPPPPPGFGPVGEHVAPPPPPPGFGMTGDIELPPPPPPGFSSNGTSAPPPPPPGFASGEDVPPPPPGFGMAGEAPPGFAPSDPGLVPPPPPPGFTPGGDAPPPPPGFISGDSTAPPPPPPPPGFGVAADATAWPGSGFVLGPDIAANQEPDAAPPLPQFSGSNSGPAPFPRTPSVSGSIADDVLAISSIQPQPQPQAGTTAQGAVTSDNGHHAADDAPPPPITPDYFARAGRRRR